MNKNILLKELKCRNFTTIGNSLKTLDYYTEKEIFIFLMYFFFFFDSFIKNGFFCNKIKVI